MKPALITIGVAMLAVLFGWPSLHGEFIDGDDVTLIRDHYLVNHPSWAHAGKLLTIVHGDLYQPLPMLTYMADYAASGENTWGYHFVNVLIHAANAALVVVLAWRIARRWDVAGLTGAMFACHPFAMAPVAWITGRILLLGALFALLTCLFLLTRPSSPPRAEPPPATDAESSGPASTNASRRNEPFTARRSICAVIAWALSLASKILPGVVPAAVWCQWRIERPRDRRWWMTVAILLAMTVAAGLAATRTTSDIGMFEAAAEEIRTPLPVRVLIASGYYFVNYVWPLGMSSWSPPPIDEGLSNPMAIAGIIGWLTLAGVALISIRCRPTATTAIGLFVLLLAPFAAALLARSFLAADRYMYVPIIGLHLMVAAWVCGPGESRRATSGANARGASARGASTCGDASSSSTRAGALRKLPCAAMIGVLAFWVIQGRDRAAAFASTVAQGRNAVELYPDDVRAHFTLAQSWLQYGQQVRSGIDYPPAEAEAERRRRYERALEVVADARLRWPADLGLASLAGEAHWNLGNMIDSVREFRAALAGRPHNVQAKYYLGLALEALGEIDEPRRLWREVFEEADHFLPAATALGRSYRDAGNVPEAIRWFEAAHAINPHHRNTLLNLGRLRMAVGQLDDAVTAFSMILEALDPNDAEAALNLAKCYALTRRLPEALALLDDLATRIPRNALITFNLGQVQSSLQHGEEAVASFRAVLEIEPANLNAALGIQEWRFRAGRFADMARVWEGVASAAPERPRGDAIRIRARAWAAFCRAMAGESEGNDSAPDSGEAASDQTDAADVSPIRDWTRVIIAMNDDAADAAILTALDAAATRKPADAEQDGMLSQIALAMGYRAQARDTARDLFVLARLLGAMGDRQAARMAAQEAAKRDGAWADRARVMVEESPR